MTALSYGSGSLAASFSAMLCLRCSLISSIWEPIFSDAPSTASVALPTAFPTTSVAVPTAFPTASLASPTMPFILLKSGAFTISTLYSCVPVPLPKTICWARPRCEVGDQRRTRSARRAKCLLTSSVDVHQDAARKDPGPYRAPKRARS